MQNEIRQQIWYNGDPPLACYICARPTELFIRATVSRRDDLSAYMTSYKIRVCESCFRRYEMRNDHRPAESNEA